MSGIIWPVADFLSMKDVFRYKAVEQWTPEDYAEASQQYLNNIGNGTSTVIMGTSTMQGHWGGPGGGVHNSGGAGGGGAGSSTLNSPQTKESTMLQEMSHDIKNFVRENKGLIYFVLLALIIDHIFFKGAFKARLESMGSKLITKVEDKIHEVK